MTKEKIILLVIVCASLGTVFYSVQAQEAAIQEIEKEQPVLVLSRYAQESKKVQAIVASTSLSFTEAEKLQLQLEPEQEQIRLLKSILLELQRINKALK